MNGEPAVIARTTIAIFTCGSKSMSEARPISSAGMTTKLLIRSMTLSCRCAPSSCLRDSVAIEKPCPSDAVTTKISPKVTMTTSSGFIGIHLSVSMRLSRCLDDGPARDRVEGQDKSPILRRAERIESRLANGAVGPGEQGRGAAPEERADSLEPAGADRPAGPEAVE